MKTVVHFLPYDGIGGVETAARSMVGLSAHDIDFQVKYLFKLSACRQRLITFNPLPILGAVRWVLGKKPDLLIVSLWRACIVGILTKLICPRIRLILFLHLPGDVHWIDRVVTRITARLSDFVWADSSATFIGRLPDFPQSRGRIISFVTKQYEANTARVVSPVFIFWGRIHLQKAIDRALGIFAAVLRSFPLARFIIIGPDGGDLARIQGLVRDQNLVSSVQFLGEMNFTLITQQAMNACFYLQTSSVEGMAMSVVESMQMGLVPVVTPVGEIASYCRQGENAVLVESDQQAVEAILRLLNCDTMYQEMRSKAVLTWKGKPRYAESVLLACESLLAADQKTE